MNIVINLESFIFLIFLIFGLGFRKLGDIFEVFGVVFYIELRIKEISRIIFILTILIFFNMCVVIFNKSIDRTIDVLIVYIGFCNF